jgi:DNA-directed RNA polymerase subunit RPC12/RpoP
MNENMKATCFSCGYSWTKKKKHPVECPECHRRLNRDPKYRGSLPQQTPGSTPEIQEAIKCHPE